ncbi:glutamate racemase [Candidatus Uhrbacteria bacterium RIFCSPHIGHO2_12_FULL_60_25]|uniref:Glutamate racemase n=1 Tax=Candidatus Uhrbacteria bacterium RIFCSPHIGHO2_12_FULL_60_25 TaxID=1802399 RepID=A0A1F7UM58_9BACT|nr:MAG: glutamate racemase [Candidatus Uhrbacteria bacterium RIFCSPHIGHO2_12_FULL_60_25]
MLGIFDSGIGGLTVVKELLRRHPQASFLYLGDTARTPYGNKSKETIERYAVEDARFLVSQGADALVVACNSMSAYAMDALRAAFPRLRIYEVITPAVEVAAKTSKGRVGVIGTRATVGSDLYATRLRSARPDLDVTSVACPLFVPLVEEGMLDARETKMIARRYLAPLVQKQVDTLILGCTHYPLLAGVIQARVGRRVRLIDSPSAVMDAIERDDPGQLSSGAQRYFFTDDNARTREIAEKWLGRTIST